MNQMPRSYCRGEPIDNSATSLFRANGLDDAYYVAVGDAGTGVSVAQNTLAALTKDGELPRYSVTIGTSTTMRGFPDYAALPAPTQVIRLIDEGTSTYSVDLATRTININSDLLTK